MAASAAPPDSAPHVVLLSDGVATQGDTCRAVEALRKAGLPVSVVPLGSCSPEVLMPQVRALRGVRRGPGVLLVEGRDAAGRALARALNAEGFAVEVQPPVQLPDQLAAIQPWDAVILVNVPAAAVSALQMETLRDYVRGGGGLVVVGGDQAFTPGGYRGTVLEELLPVESEPPRKTRRPSLAIVLVVDRSLSMEAAGAIELAKEAVRRVVGLLEPEDQLGLLAFDETARWVSPIEPVGDKSKVLQRIESLTAGGRTDMAPAIEKAHLALREAFARHKHMLVLSDGVSHPADFHALAERVARSGITISTVALGREASRWLLDDMAQIGKGRFYWCDDPKSVPGAFALEASNASRLGVCEEPFFPQDAGWHASGAEGRAGLLSPQQQSDPPLGGVTPRHAAARVPAPALLGYVETRPKPESQVLLKALHGDPLLAMFRYGLGISVAFTSDVEDRWATAWLGHAGFGPFWTQVVGRALRRADGRCADSPSAARENEPVFLAPEKPHAPRTRGADDAEEYRIRSADHALLRAIAHQTGGTYQPEPEDVWNRPIPSPTRNIPLWPHALAVAAVALVCDGAARRFARNAQKV